MKVFELYDSEGHLFAFEINNIGRWAIVRLLVHLGAEIIRKPRPFSWLRENEFCEFKMHGKSFTVCEPFGDNSRYHIGQSPAETRGDIKSIRDAFANQPFKFRFMLPSLERPQL